MSIEHGCAKESKVTTIQAWQFLAASEIASHWSFGVGPNSYVTDEQRWNVAKNFSNIIERHCPFKKDVAYVEAQPTPEPPLLQCIDCKNTESPAGAMARQFNHGRCVFCGGYFKVIRA